VRHLASSSASGRRSVGLKVSRYDVLGSQIRIPSGLSANGKLSRNGLLGSAQSGFTTLAKVNSLSPNPQLLIALHSPNRLRETGLRMCPPEKSRDSDALHCRVVRSLQSGLSRKNREMRACFAHLARNTGGNSLQPRLRGGERGIRTLGTGVSPYNGLANRRIRPLCHLSGGAGILLYPASCGIASTLRHGEVASLSVSGVFATGPPHDMRRFSLPCHSSRICALIGSQGLAKHL